MYNIYVENLLRENPIPKFVSSHTTKEEAEEALDARKNNFVFAYDEYETEIRSKYNFFIKKEEEK